MKHTDISELQLRKERCLEIAASTRDLAERYANLKMAFLYEDRIGYLGNVFGSPETPLESPTQLNIALRIVASIEFPDIADNITSSLPDNLIT